MNYLVSPSTIHGICRPTSSKSHTMRAIVFASMARGKSTICNVLPSPDTEAMISACQLLGAKIQQKESTLYIEGCAAKPQTPDAVIDVGNSGQVLRFIAALACLQNNYTIFTGDASIRGLRPMFPLLSGLEQAGAFARSSRNNGYAPIIVSGPVKASEITVEGQDSQPISALLLLAAFLEGTTKINVLNAGEKPWIALTLHWLDKFSIPYSNLNFEEYTVSGPTEIQGFEYTVPTDWSSAAFPIAAALITNSELTLTNMDFEDCQGDKAILDALEKMGAIFTKNQEKQELIIHKHKGLQGATLDVNNYIDAVPVLAAIACYASSPTIIEKASIARQKESDRLSAITQELSKMGAHIEEFPDGLKIYPSSLHGATCYSHHDHRIAMAVAVATLGSSSSTHIKETDCVSKSFPGFAACFAQLGAAIQEEQC